ncbi:MAG: BCD family MFS transporter [Roseiflexus sp.]|nr:BCD family MFS transporter [Roseiflexus sp.]MCS7288686.1 BCD family MFS transporter [Roseiflexus sp.]MDW8147230.1 BCD family MFS transporter [Roseiflexaceae bacterium]MDW8233601.1 BCD family MFS transporter [Roseiflexaceae bacterium]
MATRTHRLAGLAQRVGAWVSDHQAIGWWISVLRLGLFQLGMGIALAPITGTLNRVLIGDLYVPAAIVASLMAIHYFVSPVRAIFGYQSDVHRAKGRWRMPYIVLGAVLTYGGLATAPFSLILLGPGSSLPFTVALAVCTAIFLAYGIGVNIVETAYLALVSDITPPRERGKVLAVLWMMLVIGTIVSSIIIGAILENYSPVLLIQVMQSSAVIFAVLAAISVLGRERLRPDGTLISHTEDIRIRLTLIEQLRAVWQQPGLRALFVVLFGGTLALATHDILLEPYGGQVLGMSVAATTRLTALWGVAMITGIAIAGVALWRGRSPISVIISGCAAGALGFLVVIAAGASLDVTVFRSGVFFIGIGRGLFIVASIALIMALADRAHAGLFIGLWGVTQALAQGFGTVGGGLARDIVQLQTGSILLGYTAVYATAFVILLITLGLIAALRLGRQLREGAVRSPWSGLQDLPGDQILF